MIYRFEYLRSNVTQGYFLLGDSLNTTVTVISTLQNSVSSYNTLNLTYLLIVGIAAQVSLVSQNPPVVRAPR